MDLRVLYNKINTPDLEKLLSDLIYSHTKYFNEVLFIKISKLSRESLEFDLLFGITSRSTNINPNATEINDILEYLLLFDFNGQGYMFLSHKESTEFDAAILVHENESDYYIAFFNETNYSYNEKGIENEELEKVFSSLALIVKEKLVKFI